MTLDQLAASSGVDRGTISRIELGHVSPRVDTILFLCKAMNTTLGSFFAEPHLDGVDGHPHPAKKVNGIKLADARPLPQAPPGLGRLDVDGYWPVPTTFWNGLMEVLERFEVLIKNGRELVLVKDLAGTLLYASPPCETILGYKPADLVGQSLESLLHPECLEGYAALVARATGKAQSPAALVMDLRVLCKDQSWRRLSAKFTNQLGNPSIRAIVINALDLQGLHCSGSADLAQTEA